MQVRYRNTLEHIVALQKFVLRNTAFGKKMMVHRFMMVEIIIFLICLLFVFNHNPIKVLIGFIALSGLAWIFRERSVLMQFKKDFKREDRRDESGTFHKDRVLSIDPNGFTIRSGAGETACGWDQVDLIGNDTKYIYIVLKSVLHHVVPLSAFSDREESDQFLTAMRTFQSNPS